MNAAQLLAISCRIRRPLPVETIAAWAKRQRIIFSAKENLTYAGQAFDPDRSPVMSSLIFGFLHPREPSKELHILKPSQFGATLHTMVAFSWLTVHAPGNMFYCIDSNNQATDLSTERLEPIFSAIPELKEDLANRDRQRNKTISFSACTFYLAGAQSAGAISSKPIAYAAVDETERHPLVNDTTSINLIRARLTASDRSKLITYSSPENEANYQENPNSNRIEYVPEQGTTEHAEFLSGTQEHYHVPCPYCGTTQEMKWENLKFGHCRIETLPGVPTSAADWDKARIMRETFLLCVNEACRNAGPETVDPCAHPDAKWNFGRIPESFKPWMVHPSRGKWIPAAPEERERRDLFPSARPGRRSAQVSALYDIAFDNLRWGNLVLEFLEAESDPAKLRFFINHRLGRPWSETRHIRANEGHLRNLFATSPPYDRLNLENPSLRLAYIPFLPWSINLLADVQQSVIKWMLVAYSREERDDTTRQLRRKAGEIFVIDWGAVPFDGERRWHDALEGIIDTQIETPGGKSGSISRNCISCAIDARYQTTEILSFCFTRPWWQPLYGEGRREIVNGRPFWLSPVLIQGDKQGILPGRGKEISMLWLAANHWEEELYHRRLQQTDFLGPKAPPRIHLPSDSGNYPAFLAELSNMKKDYVRTGRGAIKDWRWIKATKGPNDYGDTLKWSLMFWDYMASLGLTPSQPAAA